MAVFLNILKWTGIVLLVILLIIILLLIYVLFIPFRYSIGFESYENVSVKGRISDFLGILQFRFQYDKDNGSVSGLHLFGMKKPIYPKEDSNEPVLTEEEPQISDSKKEKETDEPVSAEVKTDKSVKDEGSTETKDDASADNPSKKDIKVEKKRKRGKKKEDKKPKNFIEKIKEFYELATAESTHRALRYLWEKTVKLLRILAPKKMAADMEFSTGEPDITGQITGLLAMIPVLYDKKVSIFPDFESEKAYAKGYMTLYGSVALFPVLLLIIQVYFNKDCRKLYKAVK